MIASPAEFLLNVNVLLPRDGKISGIGATLAATKTNFVSYFAPARPALVCAWPAQVAGAGHPWPGFSRAETSAEDTSEHSDTGSD